MEDGKMKSVKKYAGAVQAVRTSVVRNLTRRKHLSQKRMLSVRQHKSVHDHSL